MRLYFHIYFTCPGSTATPVSIPAGIPQHQLLSQRDFRGVHGICVTPIPMELSSRSRHGAGLHWKNDSVVTTFNFDPISIRRAFDSRSTANQRSLRSQWRNTGRRPASSSHADLFINLTMTMIFIHTLAAGWHNKAAWVQSWLLMSTVTKQFNVINYAHSTSAVQSRQMRFPRLCFARNWI